MTAYGAHRTLVIDCTWSRSMGEAFKIENDETWDDLSSFPAEEAPPVPGNPTQISPERAAELARNALIRHFEAATETATLEFYETRPRPRRSARGGSKGQGRAPRARRIRSSGSASPSTSSESVEPPVPAPSTLAPSSDAEALPAWATDILNALPALLSRAKAANALCISEKSVDRICRKPRGIPSTKPGGHVVIPRLGLVQYLVRRSGESSTATRPELRLPAWAVDVLRALPPLLSRSKAAEIFGESMRTIDRLCESVGGLTSIPIGTRVVIPRLSVVDLLVRRLRGKE